MAIACWGSGQFEAGAGDGWLAPDGRAYDGYLLTCRDLFRPEPVFTTAAVRIDDSPLLPDGESFHRSGEYLGAPAFAADGSVWAGFVRDRGAAVQGDAIDGIVARFRPPPAS